MSRTIEADFQQSPLDTVIPTRANLRGWALIELCRRGLAVDLESSAPPRADITLIVGEDEPDRAVTLAGETLPAPASRHCAATPMSPRSRSVVTACR